MLFYSSHSISQNLILNGDFELNTSIPVNYGEFSKCSYWLNPSLSSPDYFHTSATGNAQLPNSQFAYVFPYSGNAVGGMIVATDYGSGYREYMTAQFIAPMIIGRTYTLSFYITNGSSDYAYGLQCDHIGVNFSTTPLYLATLNELNVTPQLEIEGEIWETNWREISFDFVADSAYHCLTIGNFYNDSITSYTLQDPTTDHFHAYYYFDKFVLIQQPLKEVNVEMPNVFSPNNDGLNDYFKPIKFDGVDKGSFSILNRWGQLVYNSSSLKEQWDGTFNGENCSNGTYFWVVNYTNLTGNNVQKNGYLTLLR